MTKKFQDLISKMSPEKQKRIKARAEEIIKELNTDESAFIYDLIREDGRLERMCEHGIGHTVGHKDPEMLKKDWIWVHGCDGCCENYKKQAE